MSLTNIYPVTVKRSTYSLCMLSTDTDVKPALVWILV